MSRAPWLTRVIVTRVIELTEAGKSEREIAAELGISVGSVRNVRQGKRSGVRSSTPVLHEVPGP